MFTFASVGIDFNCVVKAFLLRLDIDDVARMWPIGILSWQVEYCFCCMDLPSFLDDVKFRYCFEWIGVVPASMQRASCEVVLRLW